MGCGLRPRVLRSERVRTNAIVVVKAASRGKRRLASVLDSRARKLLVETMLGRVVAAVQGARAFAELSILTNDESLVPENAEWIPDADGGVNSTLAAAAVQLARRGVEAILVLPADIPLVTSRDLDAMAELAAAGTLIVAPDALHSGTNALLLAPPTLLRPRFGAGSLLLHLQAARERGVAARLHHNPNLSRDIDEPGDLAWLLDHCGDACYDFARNRAEALGK